MYRRCSLRPSSVPSLGNAKGANPSTNKDAFAFRLDVAATRPAERKPCTGFPEWLDLIFGAEGRRQGRLNTSPSAPGGC
jgi:hypothetical protein